MKNIFPVILLVVFLPGVGRAELRKDEHDDKQAPASRSVRSDKPVRSVPVVQAVRPAAKERRSAPRVYAVLESRPVVESRVVAGNEGRSEGRGVIHRRHRSNWHPEYNFYEDQYHFYPYVNVASAVIVSAGWIAIPYNGTVYYYDQDSFYADQGDPRGYIAVPPPVGIIVPALRTMEHQHIINGVLYYSHNGVYYLPVEGGYQVVGAEGLF